MTVEREREKEVISFCEREMRRLKEMNIDCFGVEDRLGERFGD